MNRFSLALAAVCLFGLASGAGATCYTCSEGFCVPAGLGEHGFSICFDDPDDGFCIVNSQSHCIGSGGARLSLISARLFELPQSADARLFPNGSTQRVLDALPAGATCFQVANALAGLTSTNPDSWPLDYWHVGIAGAKLSLGAGNTKGDGYAFAATPKENSTVIQVFKTAGQKATGQVAVSNLHPAGALLARVVVDNRPMLLLIQSHGMDVHDDGSMAALKSAQQHFKDDVQLYNGQHLMSLALMDADTGLQLP